MAGRNLSVVVQHLRELATPPTLSDADLLERFRSERDESAFAVLVERHGAMVLGICRRVLRNTHDAEDACQAAFLVLARKAGAIRKRESLASWLHGVAYHVAANLKRESARRSTREACRHELPQADAAVEVSWREIQGLLDEELARLPEHYRSPLVLCYLEGRTRDEAAQQLGWSLATLRGRLERARQRLRARLSRRGLMLSAALLASALSESSLSAALPARFVAATVQVAGPAGGVSARVAALAESALRAHFAARTYVCLGILATVLAAGLGFGLIPAAKPPTNREPGSGSEPAPMAAALPAPGDWPQWRGPNRDGVVRGVRIPQKWPRTLTEEWKVPVGEGYSSPVVVSGNGYVFSRQKEDEVVQCIDLVGGKEIWRSEPYAAPFTPGPAAPGDKKARSTPAVAGGKVYTLGVTGIVSCLDARTGKLLWRKDYSREYPTYGACASPVVEEGLCIVPVGGGKTGGLTAFDVATGEVKWCFKDWDGPSYASPIVVDLAGERQVVTFTQGNFVGVSLASGKKLWGVHCPRFDLEKCITPILYKDLIVFADSMEPLRAIRLEKSGAGIAVKEVWKAEGPQLHMSSPVLAGDWLFGFSGQKGGQLFCLDAQTGKSLWQSDGRLGAGYASILNAGSVWLVLTSAGRLLVVKPSGTACEPIAEYRVSETHTDAHPVFLGERILIKDDVMLRSFRIEPGEP
jgi:RNA polymerase sigma factor (sigma-70 family)